MDRRITLALPSHTIPRERDAEPVIVAASNLSGLMAKIPPDGRCEFCLAAPRDALRVHPGIRTSARGSKGLEGPRRGRVGSPREVLPYEPPE